jgi:NitT/TauT family transport system permease protein
MTLAARLRIALIVIAVALLELLCRTAVINPRVFIPPSRMATTLFSLVQTREVQIDMAQTFGSVAVALIISVAIGFAAGLIVHALPRLRRALAPFLATYYAVPIFIFYPVLIALFGISILPVIVMGFAFAVVSVVISTLNGLDRIPKVLRKVAMVHRLSWRATVFTLIIPSAAPHLFTGVKLAVAYCFIGVIASEFIAAPSGVGHAIAYAYNDFKNDTMYALMLLLVAVVTGINMVLYRYEQKIGRRMVKRPAK